MEKTKKMLNRDAQQIARLLQRCVETAYVTRTSPAWQAFLAYIDSIIQKGTMDVVVPERRRGACGAAASASGDFRSHSFLSISPSLHFSLSLSHSHSHPITRPPLGFLLACRPIGNGPSVSGARFQGRRGSGQWSGSCPHREGGAVKQHHRQHPTSAKWGAGRHNHRR